MLTDLIAQLLGMHPFCQELSFNQGSNFHLPGEGIYLCRAGAQRKALMQEGRLIPDFTKLPFTAQCVPTDEPGSSDDLSSHHKAPVNPAVD